MKLRSQALWISGFTVAAVALCWVLAFAGHLNVVATLLLVPYIMPVIQSLDATTRLLVFVGAPVVEFSLYSFVLGRAWLRGKLGRAVIVLAAVHLLAIIVCYLIIVSYD